MGSSFDRSEHRTTEGGRRAETQRALRDTEQAPMMKCGACGANGFRVRQEDAEDGRPARTIYTCRACSVVTAKNDTIQAPVEDDDDGSSSAPARPIVLMKGPHAKQALIKQSASKPIDVLKLAKSRLREVERELRTKRKLEAERDELKRIISAATGKPSVVRSIRTAV